MDKTQEALKLALKALKKCDAALAEELAAWDIDPPLHHVQEASNACGPAIAALREALAEQPAQQPVQEPVAYRSRLASGDYTYCKTAQFFDNAEPLYTSPQPAQQPVQEPGGLCERICAAIKAADNKSVDEAGYMLDSNDCIQIVREHFDATPQPQPAPQPRQWQGLTDEEIAEMMMQTWGCASIAPRHAPAFARAVEAKLKEKNT